MFYFSDQIELFLPNHCSPTKFVAPMLGFPPLGDYEPNRVCLFAYGFHPHLETTDPIWWWVLPPLRTLPNSPLHWWDYPHSETIVNLTLLLGFPPLRPKTCMYRWWDLRHSKTTT